MAGSIKLFVLVLFLAYPFVIYYGLVNFELWQIATVIVIIALSRSIIVKDNQSQLAKIGLYGSLFMLFLSILSIFLNQAGWLKLYPIFMSLLSFMVFFSSLYSHKTIIHKIAELKEKDIGEKKQKYMFKLTIVWCVFFLTNAIISAYTMVYMSLKYWSIYNGFVSYVLMGALLAFEFLYRHIYIHQK